MKKEYSIKDKLTLFLLASGVLGFGVILPDSLSDHNKMVHFSAHFGMSFLLALCFYMICTVKMRISKAFSYTVLILATLFIGVVYKYWEIATQGMIGNYSFQIIVDRTGVMTSMSQNLSGLMGAILLIEGLVERNLALSVDVKADNNLSKPGNQFPMMGNHMSKTGNHFPTTITRYSKAASQYSPSSKN